MITSTTSVTEIRETSMTRVYMLSVHDSDGD